MKLNLTWCSFLCCTFNAAIDHFSFLFLSFRSMEKALRFWVTKISSVMFRIYIQYQCKQKLLFQFHKHHVPFLKTSQVGQNVICHRCSSLPITYIYVKYFILLWVYQILFLYILCIHPIYLVYHTENIVHVHSDRTRRTFLYKYVTRILFLWFG